VFLKYLKLRKYSFWKQYENIKILNFSSTLYKKLKRWGFNTVYLQRYPKPFEFKDWGKEDKVFFYNRNSMININTVKKLIGKNNFKIHLHKTMDPGYEFVSPTKDDEKKYSITYSEWFENKMDKWAVAEKSAIFIAPRITEGIGQGELEAMALGRAVVAVNAPTLNEYITHNVNGYLYDFNNPQPIDFSNLREVQKNSYRSIIYGYKNWEKKKIGIINFIKSN
jgi:glycosyltransferase involved in cell wall biosynthesis